MRALGIEQDAGGVLAPLVDPVAVAADVVVRRLATTVLPFEWYMPMPRPELYEKSLSRIVSESDRVMRSPFMP